MHADRLREPLERLRRALAPADGAGLSDGQLLARFVADRDEAAFAALVRRHGPMVLGVCRRLVRHEQDAEDCFQAAFLVLARRAGSVRKRESLASWLYGVSYRVALDAAGVIARRRSRERQVGQMPQPEVPPPEPQDWRPLLGQELLALPEKYRAAVVLCDLEGKPRREAARLLGLPEGTLSARLTRARALLAGRLSRRGVALSGGALAASLAGGAATAAVPARLAESTAKVAALVAAGNAAAAATPAALLMHEFQRGMLMAKLKVCAALAAVAVLLGAGGFAYRATGQAARPAKGAAVWLERGADARALIELERLRKEVDILKVQVEVLQEQARAPRPAPEAAAPQEEKPKSDKEALQGTWVEVSRGKDGAKLPEDQRWKLVFDGDKVTVIGLGTKEGAKQSEGTFTIDPDKKPREIDLTLGSLVLNGIYERKGATLKTLWREHDRPGLPPDFEAKKGLLIVFEKEKK
jgi:RNA polymerase sigma factor (sigma-70 family)